MSRVTDQFGNRVQHPDVAVRNLAERVQPLIDYRCLTVYDSARYLTDECGEATSLSPAEVVEETTLCGSPYFLPSSTRVWGSKLWGGWQVSHTLDFRKLFRPLFVVAVESVLVPGNDEAERRWGVEVFAMTYVQDTVIAGEVLRAIGSHTAWRCDRVTLSTWDTRIQPVDNTGVQGLRAAKKLGQAVAGMLADQMTTSYRANIEAWRASVE